MTFETGFSVQYKCKGLLFEIKMCRVAASKLSLHYFHIMCTDIFKNKVLFSTFYVKMLEKNKKITKNQTFVW
jgi:hypothetical protein